MSKEETTPQKTANKYAKPSPRNGNVLPVGNHPGNTGGKKGRSGRKPDAFKDWVKSEIRDAPASRKALIEASIDSESPNFRHAWKIATDYDDEKPAEKHAIVGPIEVRVRIEREGRRVTGP